MSLKKKFSIYSNASSNYILYGSLFVFAALCIVGMAAIILTAYYGVPVGDDYLAIKTFSNSHTWFGEAWNSLTHTGRYLQSITSSVAYGSLRSHIAVILPIAIVLWLYTLAYLYVRLITEKTRINCSNIQSHLISSALLVLLVTSGQVVDVNGVWFMYQSFYFSSAIVTYTIALLFYLTLFYIYIKFYSSFKKHSRLSIILFFFITFLLGLYNETIPATLLGLSALSIVTTYLYQHRQKQPSMNHFRPYLFMLVASSFLALTVMYLSPANIARRQTTGALQENGIISSVVTKTVTALTEYVFRPHDFALIAVLALLIYVFVLANAKISRKNYLKLTGLGGLTLIASILSLTAAIGLLVLGYGSSTSLFPRTFLLVQVLFVIGVIIFFIGLFGALVQSMSSRMRTYGLLMLYSLSFIILILITPHFIGKFANNISGVATYKTIWVDQDKLLREAAATSPNATIYLDDKGSGIGDGFSVQCNSPYSKYTIWLTDSMEAYYGLREICAKSDLGTTDE